MQKPIDPWQRRNGKPVRGPDGHKLLKPLPDGIAYTWRRDAGRRWLTDEDGDRVPATRYRATGNAKTVPPGKTRHQLSGTFDSLAQARQWLADVRAGVIDWQPAPEPERRPETVNDRLDVWLASSARRVRQVTVRGYRDSAQHWRAAFGHVATVDLTRAVIESAVDGMLGAGLSPRTVRLAMVVLRGALREALAEGVIDRDPAALVALPAYHPPSKRAWTPAEARKFLASIEGNRLAGLWWLSLAGLRRSEVLGLQWSDVDLDAGTVTVARGRVAVGGHEVHVDRPKSQRSVRTLPVGAMPGLVDALRTLRATRATECLALGVPLAEDAFLAVDEALTPLRPERYSDLWREAVEAVDGLPVLTLHEARHTAASLLAAADVAPEAAAEWLGHDPAVYLRTYVHPTRDRVAGAGAALGRVYGT